MPITVRAAARHEALYLRLVALFKQTQILAAKRPEGLVPEVTRIVAEGLLFDALTFRRRRRCEWPVVAPDQAGLAVQLGQAMAALESFEALHTRWDDALKAQIWLLDDGTTPPVLRLRPKPATALPATKPVRDMAELRRKLAIRIDQFKRR